MKCDQTTPGCEQCYRQKLQCPGYQKPLKWIDTSEVLKTTAPSPVTKRQFRERRLLRNSPIYLGPESRDGRIRVQPPGLPSQLNDESFTLIQHYFTRVCKIAGCFDSDISPFRIIPATMMAYSKPVFLLLQASSAAQLSRQHPRMRYKALSLQSEAFSAVRAEIANLRSSVVSDELMLSCIIAGLTSTWYDVNDLGLCHVLGSQVLLCLWLTSKSSHLKYQETFILGAYVYWLAISAFVAGDPKSSFGFQEALQEELGNVEISYDVIDDADIPESQRKIFPHPLTGFSMQTFICVGKVGSLCRLAHTETVQTSQSSVPNKVYQHEKLLEKASFVEAELLGLFHTRKSNFQDPQDPHTTIDEILSVGEAYRCTGLLQLYMTFPQLLQQYTSAKSSSNNLTASQHDWLRSLAFHILSILETIPPTSGTRVLQGLPVLIAATWLVDSMNDGTTPFEHPQLPLMKTSKSQKEWREAVRNGLRMHDEYVGLQQVSRILEIVEEVWMRDDDGEEKCHWIVVVASKGMQTLYG